MENTQVIALAHEAAGAAFDAHGLDFPTWKVAYDFIQNAHYEAFDGDDIDAAAFLHSMDLTKQQQGWFRAAYGQKCNEFKAQAELKAAKGIC